MVLSANVQPAIQSNLSNAASPGKTAEQQAIAFSSSQWVIGSLAVATTL